MGVSGAGVAVGAAVAVGGAVVAVAVATSTLSVGGGVAVAAVVGVWVGACTAAGVVGDGLGGEVEVVLHAAVRAMAIAAEITIVKSLVLTFASLRFAATQTGPRMTRVSCERASM